LGGGDVWDQKIRKRIRECDYFMPLVSAQTEARHEGYFRREWRLAVERTLDMADDHPFLLPVVIDATDQARARVPEKFLTVQWLRVPGGQPTAALEALCRRLASGEAAAHEPARKAPRAGKSASAPRVVAYPEFPKQEPGQKMGIWFRVVGWAFRSAWIFFNQLPRWVRTIVYIWLSIALLSRGCSSGHHRVADISSADAAKLNGISEKYHGSLNKADIANLGKQIASEFADDVGDHAPERSPLLAIPFTAPAGDAAAEKLADSTFALVYGKVAIAHHGLVGLSPESTSCGDLKSALERGRSNHSKYVLCGAIAGEASHPLLTVKIAKVSEGTAVWSKSYPVAGADATKIAAEVDAQVPSLNED
jgi:TolB-like protein